MTNRSPGLPSLPTALPIRSVTLWPALSDGPGRFSRGQTEWGEILGLVGDEAVGVQVAQATQQFADFTVVAGLLGWLADLPAVLDAVDGERLRPLHARKSGHRWHLEAQQLPIEKIQGDSGLRHLPECCR